jgi:glucose-6-phosphate isomerase
MKDNMIKLDIKNIRPFINQSQLDSILPELIVADKKIKASTGAGKEFLGWLHLPTGTSKKLITDIKDTAQEIIKNADALVCIGIGGSYLGARAGIEFLGPHFQVYFCGNNLNSDYIKDLLDSIGSRKDIYVNVVSKSGTTIEPALVFRILYDFMKRRYSKKEIAKRIICTTDSKKGALKKMATMENFRAFSIPDNVGGRFSVLTPVGLLPMACAGINITEVLNGAVSMEEYAFATKVEEGAPYKYAAIRNLLYRSGKSIEILAGFHPSLHYLLEWWKQLFAESEGKDNKCIFPAIADFTCDLHSLGQLIQEGARNILETFVVIDSPLKKLKIPRFKNDIDSLNYTAGKDLDYIEKMAYEGTAQAHTSGGVPNMTMHIPKRSPYYLGQIYYFFEIAVAASGYLLGINPFNQPGVEAYKNNMYRLLKRP